MIKDIITRNIYYLVHGLDNILVEKGGALIKQKLSGNMMLAMFLNDDLIRSVLGPLGTEFQKIIGEQGAEFIQLALNDKLSDIEESLH